MGGAPPSHVGRGGRGFSHAVLRFCCVSQTRTPEGHLVVNLDPTLREVLQEIRYMTRPPLGVALPRAAQQLLKGMEGVALGGRSTSLGVVVQVYNELWAGLSEVDQLLFQHKLQQMDNVSD